MKNLVSPFRTFYKLFIAPYADFYLPVLTISLLILSSCSTQAPPEQPKGGGGEANPNLHTNVQALENWRDKRFGMFVHWGPVSLVGTEIGWSRGREIPISTYDSLYLKFNPVDFDADKWISIAKNAGMKYFVITSKHHDGFSLWQSKYTDYDIENTPIKRDLLMEMKEACDRHGIMFGTYYSILDWKHPHYTTRYHDPRPVEESDMSIYKEFLFNQVGELINDYNTNILWFDGQWEASWTHEMGMELYKYCRDLKDELLINNRVDKGFKSMEGMTDSIFKYAGDFGTPEQRIGEFNTSFPWESCITIGKQWAWKPHDDLKTARECIHTLIKTVGGDGNLLLNVGPMPDGRIEPRQVEVLDNIGTWMRINGESIYGTRGGPYLPNYEYASTHKGKTIYVHIMKTTLKELRIPRLAGVKFKSATMLGGGKIKFKEDAGFISFEIPEDLPSTYANVIAIKTNNADFNPLNAK
jgi:alpha-L-fucosidase